MHRSSDSRNITRAFQNELDKALNDLKQTEETFKKVNSDVTRLSEELRQEQQHFDHVDRIRKGLELQVKVGIRAVSAPSVICSLQELQAKLEDAEMNARRIGLRAVEKLQENIRSRERELELERKSHKEAAKQLSKCEREVRERKFELEEQKKGASKIQDLIEKLQQKIKVHKKQLEEAVSCPFKRLLLIEILDV